MNSGRLIMKIKMRDSCIKKKKITPQEFFEVWIDRDKVHEFKDDPNRSKMK